MLFRCIHTASSVEGIVRRPQVEAGATRSLLAQFPVEFLLEPVSADSPHPHRDPTEPADHQLNRIIQKGNRQGLLKRETISQKENENRLSDPESPHRGDEHRHR